jgi:hypothetical protein
MKCRFLEFNFIPRTFIYCFIGFFCSTIIGTISHEYGPILVAKYYDFPTSLHYGSMNYTNISKEKKEIDKIVVKNEQAIIKKQNYCDKIKLIELAKITNHRDFLITIGGPIQTMFVGIIGFIYLLKRKRTIFVKGIKVKDWFFVFLSLFWLREICNLTVGVLGKLFFRFKNYFGGDEKNIAIHLNLPNGIF